MEGFGPDLFKIESEARRKRQLEERVPMYEGKANDTLRRAGKAVGVITAAYLLAAFRTAVVWSLAGLMIVGFLWVVKKLVS